MFETRTDHDRKIRFQVALALFGSIALAILTLFNIVTGRFGGRAYLGNLVLTVSCFSCIIHFWKHTQLRAALILIGTQAAIRAFLSLTHMAVGWLYVANLFGKFLTLLGLIIIIFFILNWFSSARPDHSSSGGEKTNP